MFFQLKEAPIKTLDTYDKMYDLIRATLYFSCPEHRTHHHILYTANTKLDSYREARDFYRTFENPATALGTFSQEAYQLANEHYQQLHALIRGYMHLSDDKQRAHFNHHFRFSKEKIDTMHAMYTKKDQHKLFGLEQQFYEHLKTDLTPLLAQLE